MRARSRAGRWSQKEAGMTLILVAGAMVVLLGISALAIDLVALYVARNEAQRAADAAALAGATMFLSQGCTTGVGGCVQNGPQEAPATTQAINVAAQNLVFGQAPSSSTVATTFSYPNAEEPQITVTVYRDSAHGNAMPTFFAKIFGITTANVSASATAEAYNPSGGGVSVGVSCLKPFLVPNCDPDHPVPSTSPVANKACAGTSGGTDGATVPCPLGVSGTCYPSYFFDPNRQGAIVNPGAYKPGPPPSGGVIGEDWQLHSEAGPSQWYLIGYTGNSGAQLRAFIQMCAPAVIACSSSLNTANGKKVGPVDQGINALIHANADGLNQGQDSMCSPTTTPACVTPSYPITGGTNNPNPALVGKTFYSPSDSIASVAVYDGHALPPGGSTVTILGFMQLFIRDANHVGNADLIDTVILNIGGCGTSNSAPPPLVTQGGSTIPIRLIHQ
jgi:hypothetical protein